MVSEKIKQIFTNPNFWNDVIPQPIKNIVDQQHHQTWWNSQSRTLNTVLNQTIGYYSSGRYDAFKTLPALCSLIMPFEKINIYARYKLISSEDAETLTPATLTQYLDMPDSPPQNCFNFIFYHIPKGKSYLKKLLDETPDLMRLQQIETFCIEGISHFIRVYRNYNNTGMNTITVFSDQYTPSLISTLYVMLPHLINIVPRETTDSEEQTINQRRIGKLLNIFELLFHILTAADTNVSYVSSDYAIFKETFKRYIKNFTDEFDFVTAQLDSFTSHLAKARNKNALNYFTRQLDSTKHDIADWENRLANAYQRKVMYERQLIAHKQLSDDDVKPFIDTIKNTKAIEILSTTQNEMVLRITAPFQYFQEADLEAYEHNTNSEYMQLTADKEILRKVLHKVFVTREYQILAQGIIHIQIQDNYERNPLYLFVNTREPEDYTQCPNPHLYFHNCWGAAQAEINKNTAEGNFELAIMQMVAAVQSINVAERASFVNGFINNTLGTSLKGKVNFLVNTPEGTKTYNLDEILIYEQNLEKQNTLEQAEKTIKTTAEYTQVEIPDDDANWEE